MEVFVVFWWIMKLGSCRFNADVDARALPQILRSERGPGHASICSSFPDFGWFFFVIFSSIFLKFSVPGARSRRVLTLNEERIEKFVARGEKWFFENCTFSTLTGPFSAVSARNFESKTIWVRNSTRSNRICKKKKSKFFRFFIEIFDDHKSAKWILAQFCKFFPFTAWRVGEDVQFWAEKVTFKAYNVQPVWSRFSFFFIIRRAFILKVASSY